MKAVVDTSVLIALEGLSYIELIARLFDTIIVVNSVIDEITGSKIYSAVEEMQRAGSVKREESSNRELLDTLSLELGKGEAETIAVASKCDDGIVLLDDLRARKRARSLGLRVTGTLGLLRTMIDKDLINNDPFELCDKLLQQGFWIKRDQCNEVLGRAHS
ncbi:MAG: hypothetical protein ACLFVP_09170 [Candidatus Bathyarchaeia archaeon]